MQKNNKNAMQINEQIDVQEVRLIDAEGATVGIMTTAEALKIAEEKDLDLILISPVSTPPVAKIGNYSKLMYDLSKKQKQQRKNSKSVELKQINLRFCTAENDLQTKLKFATTFLKEGNKVFFSIFFKMRERSKKELGVLMMKKVAARLSDIASMEKEPNMDNPKTLSMILGPLKKGQVVVKTEEEEKPVEEPTAEQIKLTEEQNQKNVEEQNKLKKKQKNKLKSKKNRRKK